MASARDIIAAEIQARDLVRNSRSSFYWAMRILPANKRQAMYAIYAFCRIIDDIADGAGQELEKRARLNFWRQQLDQLYQGNPGEFVGLALLQPVRRYDLRQDDFLAVIEGMERDAGPSVRMANEADLQAYCDAVACSVGRLSNQVFGIDRVTGAAIAGALGQALQLTNILRDVAEDAACDRLYMPRDLLARHGIESDDPVTVIGDLEFPAACRELAGVALEHYQNADRLLDRCGRKRLRPAVLMMENYRRVLAKLQRRGWRHLDRPVRLTLPEKIGVMVRYGWLPL